MLGMEGSDSSSQQISVNMAQWMENGSLDSVVLPLSMIALKKCLDDLAMSRQPAKGPAKSKENSNEQEEVSSWLSFEEEFSVNRMQSKALEHVFRKHVKPKKQHEISRYCIYTLHTHLTNHLQPNISNFT